MGCKMAILDYFLGVAKGFKCTYGLMGPSGKITYHGEKTTSFLLTYPYFVEAIFLYRKWPFSATCQGLPGVLRILLDSWVPKVPKLVEKTTSFCKPPADLFQTG